MGREAYQVGMERRLRDLSFQIDCVRAHLTESSHEGLRAEMAEQLAWLEHRRDGIREMLEALSDEPDGTWEDLRAEVEDAWEALAQDFEEHFASLA